jgi:hypothetical protein
LTSCASGGGSHGALDFEPVEALGTRVLSHRALGCLRCFEPDAPLLAALFVIAQLLKCLLLTV